MVWPFYCVFKVFKYSSYFYKYSSWKRFTRRIMKPEKSISIILSFATYTGFLTLKWLIIWSNWMNGQLTFVWISVNIRAVDFYSIIGHSCVEIDNYIKRWEFYPPRWINHGKAKAKKNILSVILPRFNHCILRGRRNFVLQLVQLLSVSECYLNPRSTQKNQQTLFWEIDRWRNPFF